MVSIFILVVYITLVINSARGSHQSRQMLLHDNIKVFIEQMNHESIFYLLPQDLVLRANHAPGGVRISTYLCHSCYRAEWRLRYYKTHTCTTGVLELYAPSMLPMNIQKKTNCDTILTGSLAKKRSA